MRRVTATLLAVSCLLGSGSLALAAEGQMLIVNKASNKMAFYDKGELVRVFNVATGGTPTATPEGWFHVIRKQKNVPYYKTGIPGGDPRNPLGDRWLGLNITQDGSTYGIHGNNDESSIGKYVSLGCVRMHNNEVRWLYDLVANQTPVTITRSNQGFDALAQARGYQLTINNVIPYPTSMMVLDVATLYSKPHDYYRTGDAVAPQRVQAFEKKGDWFHIKTWNGDSWIKDGQHVLVGAVTSVNKTVNLTQNTLFYRYPKTGAKAVGTLAPQPVTAFEEWNGWYRIKTWMGDMWVKKN